MNEKKNNNSTLGLCGKYAYHLVSVCHFEQLKPTLGGNWGHLEHSEKVNCYNYDGVITL